VSIQSSDQAEWETDFPIGVAKFATIIRGTIRMGNFGHVSGHGSPSQSKASFYSASRKGPLDVDVAVRCGRPNALGIGCSYHILAGALPDFAQVLLLHTRAHASSGHYLSQMVLSISLGFPYGLSQLGCYEDLVSCNTTF
jgi:hypothetical protein